MNWLCNWWEPAWRDAHPFHRTRANNPELSIISTRSYESRSHEESLFDYQSICFSIAQWRHFVRGQPRSASQANPLTANFDNFLILVNLQSQRISNHSDTATGLWRAACTGPGSFHFLLETFSPHKVQPARIRNSLCLELGAARSEFERMFESNSAFADRREQEERTRPFENTQNNIFLFNQWEKCAILARIVRSEREKNLFYANILFNEWNSPLHNI